MTESRLVIVGDYERAGPGGSDDKVLRAIYVALDPSRVLRRRCTTMVGLLAEIDAFEPAKTTDASITLIGHGAPGQFMLRMRATSAQGLCQGTDDGDHWTTEIEARLSKKINGVGLFSVLACGVGRGDGVALVDRFGAVCPTLATLAGFEPGEVNPDGTLVPGVSVVMVSPGAGRSYPNGYCGWPAPTNFVRTPEGGLPGAKPGTSRR